MKLFGSKSYVDAPPAPKMPQGLIELMEGLTKEVLKNNPTEVYEFCAEHMRKLLELRDHDTRKQCLTLEQKISKANSVIRQRAEKRRQKYDNDMQILQKTEHLIDTSEKRTHDPESVSMKVESNLLNENLERNDEHSKSNTVTKSEHSDNNETCEIFNNVTITSEGVEKNTDKIERNQSIDNNDSPVSQMQYEMCENIIVANDNNTKENCSETVANDLNDNNAVNTIINEQENIGILSKDINNDANDKELADKRCTDTCDEKENYTLTSTIATDPIVAADEVKDFQTLDDIIQGYGSSVENGQNKVNEETGIIGENNQREIEDTLVITTIDQKEIEDETGIKSSIMQEDLEEHCETGDGGLNSMGEEAVVVDGNNQKEIEEQSIINDEGNQIEIQKESTIDDKNNQKEIEPLNNQKEDDQSEIKDEVVFSEEKNDAAQNESNENAINKGGNIGKDVQGEFLAIDESKTKEVIKQITFIHLENKQKELSKVENDGEALEEIIDTNDDKKQNIMDIQNSSNSQNGQTVIQEQVDMKLITEEKTSIECEQDLNEVSISIVNEAKIGGSETNQHKAVFESTQDISSDRLKDELDLVKDDGSKSNPEDGSGVTDNLTSNNKEDKMALEHADSDSGTVSNSENFQINVDPLHLDEDADEDKSIDKPLILSIDLHQKNHDLVSCSNQSEPQNIDNHSENDHVETKESGTVESKSSKPMDLETAAITIQKVFRNFLFRSKTASFDDPTNIEFNIFDHESGAKDIVYSNQSQILNKDKRPMGISRMDTVLQTVNEEKSLSLSTDDSSTLSSAATVIQAHIRGFLVRNRLNRNKTISSTSLADSDGPPASFETDPDPARNKTVLNIHIVPEGSHFLSRDESMLTSVELSLDGSPPASSNLHPLGYDKSERRKQLKREDAVQSISPPSNNSTRLSDEHDSVKEVLLNEGKSEVREAVDDELPVDSVITEDSDSEDVLSKGTVEEKRVENPNSARTPDKKAEVTKTVSSDELDVVTPFENTDGKNYGDSDGNKLVHSSEFHDVVLPTKVSRNDTSVVRGE